MTDLLCPKLDLRIQIYYEYITDNIICFKRYTVLNLYDFFFLF